MNAKDNHLSRRDFLKHTALGVAGAGVGINVFRNLQVAFGADESLPSFDTSRVIAVKRSGVMKEGMFTLTGKKTTAEAWRPFCTPERGVRITGTPICSLKLSARPEVVNAI